MCTFYRNTVIRICGTPVLRPAFQWSALRVKVYLDVKDDFFQTNFVIQNKIINHIFEKENFISPNLYLKINTAPTV